MLIITNTQLIKSNPETVFSDVADFTSFYAFHYFQFFPDSKSNFRSERKNYNDFFFSGIIDDRFKTTARLMSQKCELKQRATNTKSISIIVPAVPFSGKHPSKHTHTETLYTQSHVRTHRTNSEDRSDNVAWEHIFPQLTPNKLLIVHNCFLYPHCRGLNGCHEYVATCCYGNLLLDAVSVRGKIDSHENKEDFFFFLYFSFFCRGTATAEGKAPSSAFQSTAPLLQGAHSFSVETVTTQSAMFNLYDVGLLFDKSIFF